MSVLGKSFLLLFFQIRFLKSVNNSTNGKSEFTCVWHYIKALNYVLEDLIIKRSYFKEICLKLENGTYFPQQNVFLEDIFFPKQNLLHHEPLKLCQMLQLIPCTLEKNPYECRIDFFPPKITVKFQVNGICHKVLTYLVHIML